MLEKLRTLSRIHRACYYFPHFLNLDSVAFKRRIRFTLLLYVWKSIHHFFVNRLELFFCHTMHFNKFVAATCFRVVKIFTVESVGFRCFYLRLLLLKTLTRVHLIFLQLSVPYIILVHLDMINNILVLTI